MIAKEFGPSRSLGAIQKKVRALINDGVLQLTGADTFSLNDNNVSMKSNQDYKKLNGISDYATENCKLAETGHVKKTYWDF